jgi:hypothetical protein
MLNELIILANDFDQKGLRKEANSVDFLIQKFAGNENLLKALLEALLFFKQPKELTEELTEELRIRKSLPGVIFFPEMTQEELAGMTLSQPHWLVA